MITFEELGIDNQILKAIKELGFENPMPIQEKVIPQLLKEDSRDIIGLAQTGTGKTAAFGIPIVEKVNTKSNKVQFLILSPTRELCLQISEDLESYAKYKSDIKFVAIFGGASIEKQIQKVQRGVHVISATPGRLLDLINRNVVDLSNVKTVVLDEADEMLNMGFRDDLEEILQETPSQKNTLLFSATMPNEVLQIASRYMDSPLEISAGKKNVGADNIEHVCYMVHARDRYLALKRIVDFYPGIYGIVFCRTRKETQEIADQLMQDGYNADSLHGDLSQAQRDTVMNKFRIRHLSILVATDVAARGIDVDSLSHIINYNLPDELEVYTHRSGRTGRAGKKGISIIIANLKEKGKIYQIEKQINKKFKFSDVPMGKDICEKQLFHLIDRMEKTEVENSQIDPYLPAIFKKLEWMDTEELIKKFVSVEFNRFSDYYKNAPDLSIPIEGKRTRENKKGGNYQLTRFFINLGRTDDLKPATLIGMINDFTGVRDIEIGEIEILQNYSFFEVDSAYSDSIISSFKDKKMKKRAINVEVSESKRNSGSSSSSRRRSYSDDSRKKDYSDDSSRRGRSDSSRKRSYSDDSEKRGYGDDSRKRYSSGDDRKKSYSDDSEKRFSSDDSKRRSFSGDSRRSSSDDFSNKRSDFSEKRSRKDSTPLEKNFDPESLKSDKKKKFRRSAGSTSSRFDSPAKRRRK